MRPIHTEQRAGSPLHLAVVAAVALVALLGLLWAPSRAQATTWTVVRLTNNDYDDVNPRVADGRVAWQGSIGGDADPVLHDIFWQDLAGGSTQRITMAGRDDAPDTDGGAIVWSHFTGSVWETWRRTADGSMSRLDDWAVSWGPRISGDTVVWAGWVRGPTRDTIDVKLFSPPGTVLNLSKTPLIDEWPPVIDGRVVAWTGGPDGAYDLYLDDGTSELPMLVAHSGHDIHDPAVGGGWVAFYDDTDDHLDLYRPGIGVTQISAGHAYTGGAPDVSGGRVVWDDWVTDAWVVRMWDPAGGEQTLAPGGAALSGEKPRIDGDLVVWTGTGADGPGVFIKNLSTGSLTYLTSGGQAVAHAEVGDGAVTWMQNDGTDWEVYAATSAPGGPPVVQTTSPLVGATSSSLSPTVSATFEDALDPATVGDATFYLETTGGGGHVAAAVSYVAGTRTALLTPLAPLAPDTKYLVTLTTGIHSGDGSPLTGPYSWAFFTPAVPLDTFVDVPPTYPYHDAIEMNARDGVIRGYDLPGGLREFRPEADVLRWQFAKMIVGRLSIPVDDTVASPFNDLGSPADPAARERIGFVAAAVGQEIVQGYPDGTFRPWNPVSRAQVVSMVVRVLRHRYPSLLVEPPSAFSGTLGRFSPDHADNMRWAEFNGLLDHLQGFGASWNPWNAMSRGETAQILASAMATTTATGP